MKSGSDRDGYPAIPIRLRIGKFHFITIMSPINC